MSLKQEETSAPPISSSIGQQQTDQRLLQQRGLGATAPTAPENRHQEAQTVQASPISAASLRALGGNQQCKSELNFELKKYIILASLLTMQKSPVTTIGVRGIRASFTTCTRFIHRTCLTRQK